MASTGASLRGELTVYKNDPTLVMFTSGPEVSDSEGTAVFIGGLTDRPDVSLCYLPALAAALEEKRWRLCQPTLSSAYHMLGVSDLDKDAEELDLVVDRILASASAIEKKKKHAGRSPRRALHGVPRHRALPEAREGGAARTGARRGVRRRCGARPSCMEHARRGRAAAAVGGAHHAAEGAGVHDAEVDARDVRRRAAPRGTPVFRGRMTPDGCSGGPQAHELSRK